MITFKEFTIKPSKKPDDYIDSRIGMRDVDISGTSLHIEATPYPIGDVNVIAIDFTVDTTAKITKRSPKLYMEVYAQVVDFIDKVIRKMKPDGLQASYSIYEAGIRGPLYKKVFKSKMKGPIMVIDKASFIAFKDKKSYNAAVDFENKLRGTV